MVEKINLSIEKKELQNLLDKPNLHDFFEVKRKILHKIVDAINGSDELHTLIDDTYTSLPENVSVESIRKSCINLIDKISKIERFGLITHKDIPIYEDTCPYCVEYDYCGDCPYGLKHGVCDPDFYELGYDTSDWLEMFKLFKETFKKYIGGCRNDGV